MILARDVLDHLAGIGATVQPAGDQLILRAGPKAIPATLVRQVREAKADLLEMLAANAVATQARGQEGGVQGTDVDRENLIVRRLDEHPQPSAAGRCAYCSQHEWRGAVVVPFGVTLGTHTWLHPECWPAWHERRRADALRALQPYPVSE
jgi:hypothetical protein